MKMGEAMYKDQQSNGAPGTEGGEQSQPNDNADGPKYDDVIDADFEEVDDDKKASGQ
jgi:molecular chaperone DnaK